MYTDSVYAGMNMNMAQKYAINLPRKEVSYVQNTKFSGVLPQEDHKKKAKWMLFQNLKVPQCLNLKFYLRIHLAETLKLHIFSYSAHLQNQLTQSTFSNIYQQISS